MSREFPLDDDQITGPTHQSRQVDDDERRLYDRARQQQRDIPDGCAVRLFAIARDLGIREERASELLRRWQNEDRWRSFSEQSVGRFTDHGMTTDLDQE